MVYALFGLRNGNPPPPKRRLQFPICEKSQDFKSRVKPDLEGLSSADVAAIEKAQPYNGGQWLRSLKALAEEHKHRKLVYLTSTSRVQMRARITDSTDATGYHVLPLSGVRAPKTMYVHTQIAGPIAFSDGTPIVDKLEILQAQVASLLDTFKPLFS